MRDHIRKVALLEPSVASECVVTEMMGQIRTGSPFLAGALADAGFAPRVFAEELIDFTPELLAGISKDYDAVGISLALNTLPRGLQVARLLREQNPDLPIIMGGPSASAYADRLLASCDVVLKGRGETVLPKILRNWKNFDLFEEIPGTIFRKNGEIFRNRAFPPPSDGATRYDLIEGFGPLTIRQGLFGYYKPAVFSLFGSTGCVRHCKFCKSDKNYVHRNYDNIIRDLELLLKLNPGNSLSRFMLVDDCLFADLDWTKELLRRIEHACRGHRVSFSAQFHVQPAADNELMRLFRQARFTSLAIGFESCSQASLDHENKGTTVAQNDLAIEQCRRFGIVPYGYFVVGFDSDTPQTVEDNFDYIMRMKIIAQVLPVGIMNRDEDGNTTPEADRVLSDTSFGATVFVSHRPAGIKASGLQKQLIRGYDRITSLRRMKDFRTLYEFEFLFGFNRCYKVWRPYMVNHVNLLDRIP